jgi:hypothetical protein
MPVRWIAFWVNGHRMRLCVDCERPYRGRLLRYRMADGRWTFGAPSNPRPFPAPLAALRHYVTGAVERGEAEPIAEVRAEPARI